MQMRRFGAKGGSDNRVRTHSTCCFLTPGKLKGHRNRLLTSPSSRGLGHHPFTVKTRVRLPLGTPLSIPLIRPGNSHFGDLFAEAYGWAHIAGGQAFQKSFRPVCRRLCSRRANRFCARVTEHSAKIDWGMEAGAASGPTRWFRPETRPDGRRVCVSQMRSWVRGALEIHSPSAPIDRVKHAPGGFDVRIRHGHCGPVCPDFARQGSEAG